MIITVESVLISINPKWCALIASGKKTIEVRKTRPKIDTPFKCYIYCTLPKKYYTVMPHYRISNECLHKYHGKIKMGDGLDILCADDYESCVTLNGMVIGEFVCDKMIPIQMVFHDFYVGEWIISHEEMYQTQLTLEELDLYGRNAKNGMLYGWNISELKLYEKPKPLSEFISYNSPCEMNEYGTGAKYKEINRPPQSWCYISEVMQAYRTI